MTVVTAAMPRRARLSELDIIYNPTLGAYLLWRAANGYFRETSRGLPVAFAFLVLPVALHEQSKQIAASTKLSSGLTMFAAKLGVQQESLLALHDRALALRELTLASVVTGAAVRIFHLDASTAQLLPLEAKPVIAGLEVAKVGAVCEKVGSWFGRLPPEQVASSLRVVF